MAAQSASVVKLYEYKPYNDSPVRSQDNTLKSLSLVRDSYSGKFYGSDTYEALIGSIKQAESYFSDIISNVERNGGDSRFVQKFTSIPQDALGRTIPNTVSLYDEAKMGLQKLKGTSIEAANYVQKPQMVESFNADPTGWNNYFESSYKAPRVTEENNALMQQKTQGNQGGSATGNQLISSNLEIRKEVGTGIGKGSVGLNPFGQLDAGLNI